MDFQDPYKQLSAQYKQQKTHTHAQETRKAYTAARLPATYAVITAVLSRMLEEKNIPLPESVLDLGSGPGTAILALESLMDQRFEATLMERDPGFIEIAKEILSNEYTWVCGNMLNAPFSAHDWVIASYSFNELPVKAQPEFIQKAFAASKSFLIIIEPGTPQGFKNILSIRNILIKNGAHIVFPCPHQLKCPLEDTPVWCHFSQRLSRTRLHKAIKNAVLGYEDEKYCYLVAAKEPFISSAMARIISTPKKHSGHLEFSLCAPDGSLEKKLLSKSKCSSFKEMKKKEWGDSFNPETIDSDA